MKHAESSLQKSCIKWFRYQYPDKVLFAIPNGGKRSYITAAILSGEGVIPGVLDLLLMEPTNEYKSMFIEMKAGKNGLTDYQKEFIKKAEKRNFKCVIIRSFEDFKNTIDNYLNY